ncbi:MAG: DUF2267 domain-containing protein [Oceanicaulis sp.]
MADTKVNSLDDAVHKTNVILKEIEEEAGLPDREAAYRALKGVLITVRDRIPTEPATQLGAQLPILVRGFYYEQFAPARQPDTVRSKTEFLTRLAERFDPDDALLNDPEATTRAVLAVVGRHIDPGEAEKARHMLNDDLKTLWPLAA